MTNRGEPGGPGGSDGGRHGGGSSGAAPDGFVGNGGHDHGGIGADTADGGADTDLPDNGSGAVTANGGTGARTRGRDPLPWRLASVIGLLVLSPVAAEYLIGYDDSVGNPLALVGGLLILGPLYGGAALLIREAVRRTGGGWPAMILLAAAFGVLQAGLVDQSMFNDAYRDIDYWDDSRSPTLVPLLGISAQQGFQFVTGHVIWSICAPIAVIESLAPRRAARPWLGPFGLAVTAVLYLAASWLILDSHLESEGAVLSVPQAIGAAVVIAVLIGSALTVGRRAAGRGSAMAERSGQGGTVPGTGQSDKAAGAGADEAVPVGAGNSGAATAETIREGSGTAEADRDGTVPVGAAAISGVRRAWTPHPLLVGAAAMALLAFQQFVPTWPGFLLDVGTLAALAVLLLWGARRPGWGAMHRLAAAGGALLTSALWAFAVTPLGDVPYAAKLAHNAVILTSVVALLATAAWQIRRTRRTE